MNDSFGIINGTLKEVLGDLVARASTERQKKDSYKALFKAGSTYTGFFRAVKSDMMDCVLDACEVLNQKHGIHVSNDQFNFLLAIPYLAQMLEKEIKAKDGIACSVDKVYFILSERFKELD